MSSEAELAAKTVGTWEWIVKNWIPTMYMTTLAAIGGIVNFRQKMKAGNTRVWNLTELIGEMFVSAFAGFVTYFLCLGFGVNDYLMVAAVAISGHMGARAIFLLEQKAQKTFQETE